MSLFISVSVTTQLESPPQSLSVYGNLKLGFDSVVCGSIMFIDSAWTRHPLGVGQVATIGVINVGFKN